jgi:hypothetical protein
MLPLKRIFKLLPALLLLLTLQAGNSQAVLLDFGPIVPKVVGSTLPNLGHGFPLWFRDTNRVPLQLCLVETPGCFFLNADLPNPGQPVVFPTNIPDEIMYYTATATLVQGGIDVLLFSGVEMNFAILEDGSTEHVGFSRIRIRIDTTVAGDYVVTTPWKQYTFTDVPIGTRAINFTEDIGLGPNGQFAGILLGDIGPFIYSVGAPFGTPGNLYVGDGALRLATGSTFIPPGESAPANYLRVQGPGGLDVSTNLFSITGKILEEPTPTPLTVERMTYSRNASEMQYNAFATSQALSNQTNPAATFPGNFALTGAPSALDITGIGVTVGTMTTNSPGDGKFFHSSGLFANPATLPATVTVTNTADVPVTTKEVPLVDEVIISEASYAPSSKTLKIVAASGETKAPLPILQAFMPDEPLPLGNLNGGQLSVTFPLTLGAKTYNIPPDTVTVVSSIGGSDAKVVAMLGATGGTAGFSVSLSADVPSPQILGTTITFTALGAGGSGTYEYEFWVNSGLGFEPVQPYSAANTFAWTPASSGAFDILVNVRNAGTTVSANASNKIFFYQIQSGPASSVSITPSVASPQLVGTPITFTALGSGGSGSYEYRFWLNSGAGYAVVQGYSTLATWTWTPSATGNYDILVDVRNQGTSVVRDALNHVFFYQITP